MNEIPPIPKSDRICSPGWAYSASTGHLHRMSCKRRLCETCGKDWSQKWRSALQRKADYQNYHGRPVPTRALTLTFACNPGHVAAWNALRKFWEMMRTAFGPQIGYFRVTEFNQSHTLPHFHILLQMGDTAESEAAGYVPQARIQAIWIKAQQRAHFEKIAFNVRIEKIRGNAQMYFTKYITKLTDGKDEVPRRANWQGRGVSYSKGFFPGGVAALATWAGFVRQLQAEENIERLTFHVKQSLASLSGFLEESDGEFQRLSEIVNRPWNPKADRDKIPPGQAGLLDSAGLKVEMKLGPALDKSFPDFFHTSNFGGLKPAKDYGKLHLCNS